MTIEDLHNRYTVKKFDPEATIDDETVELLKQTFHLAPSSLNIQAWKLIVVSSAEAKERLSAAGQAGNAHRIKNAAHVFVFARKRWVGPRHIKRVINDTKMLSLSRESMGVKDWMMAFLLYGYFWAHGARYWVKQQLYIPLGMMLAVCAERGIGSSPMEGIKIGKANKALDLKGYSTVAVLAIGQPHPDDNENPSKLHKDRLPFAEVVETR
jgi:nitroreductase/dihydropteridine reductase